MAKYTTLNSIADSLDVRPAMLRKRMMTTKNHGIKYHHLGRRNAKYYDHQNVLKIKKLIKDQPVGDLGRPKKVKK